MFFVALHGIAWVKRVLVGANPTVRLVDSASIPGFLCYSEMRFLLLELSILWRLSKERRHIKRNLDHAVNKCRQLGFGQGADLGAGHIAVIEDHQGRDAADAILGGSVRIRIDVHLADLQLAVVLISQLCEDRRNHLARATPFGPEVYQYGSFCLEYILLETAV